MGDVWQHAGFNDHHYGITQVIEVPAWCASTVAGRTRVLMPRRT